MILRKGYLISAAYIGLLTTCGIPYVDVVARRIVVVLSTSEDLLDESEVDLEDPLPSGRIIYYNRPMLLACVQEAISFCEGFDLGIVRDTYETVKEELQKAIRHCHIVVTSGGVSYMGRKDVVNPNGVPKSLRLAF